jgi:hypothetical protein
MNTSSYIYIIILTTIVFSCGSSHKSATKKSVKAAVKQAGMGNDTIPALQVPAPHHAPNITLAKGKIVSVHFTGTDSSGIIKFKVLEFLGRGSAATAVSPGDTLTVKVFKLPKTLKQGKIFTAELEYRQVIAGYKKMAPPWLLVGVERKNQKGKE